MGHPSARCDWILPHVHVEIKNEVSRRQGHLSLGADKLEQALQLEDRNQILLVARALVAKGEKKGKYF